MFLTWAEVEKLASCCRCPECAEEQLGPLAISSGRETAPKSTRLAS
jgi:hypothetical protein